MRFIRTELSPTNKKQYLLALGLKDIELLHQEALSAHRFMPNTPDLHEAKQRLSKIAKGLSEALTIARQDGDEGEDLPKKERQEYRNANVINPMSAITRFEVIDHRPVQGEHGIPTVKGRVIVEYNVKVESSVQDKGRTLKIFINGRNLAGNKIIKPNYVVGVPEAFEKEFEKIKARYRLKP